MRPLLIAGIVLFGLGAFVFIRGGSFSSQKDVLSVGDLQITAEERQTIPPWAAGAAMVGGLVLIVSGVRRRG